MGNGSAHLKISYARAHAPYMGNPTATDLVVALEVELVVRSTDEIDLLVVAVDGVDLKVRTGDEVDLVLVALDEVDLVIRS